MASPDRRSFLKFLGGASALTLAGTPLIRSLSASPAVGGKAAQDEFFIFIHVSGGWDVLLSLDPRNERVGLIDPPTTQNTSTGALQHWNNRSLGNGQTTFDIVQPSGCNIPFGPAMGNLLDFYDRLCVINGVAMNTVSHPGGTVYAATGKHIVGSRAVSPSLDTIIANEFGLLQLFPLISVSFPSAFVGGNLDRRARPVRVDQIAAVGKSLTRTGRFDDASERDLVTQLLIEESNDLAEIAYYREAYDSMSQQLESLREMLASDVRDAFVSSALKSAYPEFNYSGTYHRREVLGAAFALEAFKRDIVRCASFTLFRFDSHNVDQKYHGLKLQEGFDMLATLIDQLDSTPHPYLSGDTLSEHTHIFVMSEFCRGPMLNPASGRDHYPNNSALIISPRFKGNMVYGHTDLEQLLPSFTIDTEEGERPIGPPDLLTTFMHAFGVDSEKYLREGEVLTEILA